MADQDKRNYSQVGETEKYVHGFRDVSANPTRGITSKKYEKLSALKKKLK